MKPEIDTVPPVLLYNSNVVEAEKYVPPVTVVPPPEDVIPVITTDEPSLLFKVSADVPELYVPPVTVPVKPVIDIVPPVLLNKSKVVVAE